MKIFIKANLLILAVCFLISGCKKEVVPAAAAPVNAVKVLKADLPFNMQYPGVAVGSLEVEVRAQAGGILKERLYTEGAYVEQDQQMFQIDDVPYKITLEKASAALAQAKSQVMRTKNDYDRMAYLYKRKSVSKKDYDDASAAYAAAKADEAAARADVDGAQINLGYTKVLAPVSGIAADAIPAVGSLINPQDQSGLLTKIVQINPINVNFSMPAADFTRLARGFALGSVASAPEHAQVVVRVILPDGSLYPGEGNIVFFDSSENPETSSISVHASLPNENNSRVLMPGQFVRVNLEGAVYKDALVIPSSAVLDTPQGTIAFVVKEDGVLELRVLQGAAQGSLYMLNSGLKEGESVVSEGLIKVKNGQRVNVTLKDFQLPSPPPPEEAVTLPGVGGVPFGDSDTLLTPVAAPPVSAPPLVSETSKERVQE